MKKIIFILFACFFITTASAKKITSFDMTFKTISSTEVVLTKVKKTATEINVPDTLIRDGLVYTVVAIDGWSLSSCTALESCVLGKNVTKIGMFALANCQKLESVTCLGEIRFIDEFAFTTCAKLVEINMDGNTTLPDFGSEVFFDCKTVIINLKHK